MEEGKINELLFADEEAASESLVKSPLISQRGKGTKGNEERDRRKEDSNMPHLIPCARVGKNFDEQEALQLLIFLSQNEQDLTPYNHSPWFT